MDTFSYNSICLHTVHTQLFKPLCDGGLCLLHFRQLCFFSTALLIIRRDASRQHWISLGSIIIYVRDTPQLRGKERDQFLCNRIPNCKTPLHRVAVRLLTRLSLPHSQVGQAVQNNLYNTTLRSLKRSCTPCFTSCKLTFFKAVLFFFFPPHTTKYIKPP